MERGLRHNAGSGTFGESPASGPAPTTAGHHKHDILNKLDPRVDSTQDRRPAATMQNPTAVGNNNIPAGTYGPHNSRIANALDPRVDSDLDGRAQRGGGMPGSNSNTGVGVGGGMGMTSAAAAGSAGYGAGNANIHRAGAPEGTYGPHSSRMANALDPRVDSDRDGRGSMGTASSGYPHDGMVQNQGNYGSGGAYGQPVGGAGQHGGYGVGAMSGGALPGPAPNTAGPHKSDLMNKLDPRVDSKIGGGVGAGKESRQFSERRGI
ncbi:hypothetical protein B0T14DRAFT_530071 [Immersiella caudata]|uniref:Uncharacterized protein n=1 Tax=Immersiella caudata TaxID=314043 RepID=A0AA39W4D4_9PEZI|nr:hypothetical protein B0T14DRAFT_530071 [Immersiella caudata]